MIPENIQQDRGIFLMFSQLVLNTLPSRLEATPPNWTIPFIRHKEKDILVLTTKRKLNVMSCNHKKVIGQLSIRKRRNHQNPDTGAIYSKGPVNHPNVKKNLTYLKDLLLRLTLVSTRIVTYYTVVKIISHRCSLKKKRMRAGEYSRECPNTSSPKRIIWKWRTLSHQVRTPRSPEPLRIHQQNQTIISHSLIKNFLPTLRPTFLKRVITMWENHQRDRIGIWQLSKGRKKSWIPSIRRMAA